MRMLIENCVQRDNPRATKKEALISLPDMFGGIDEQRECALEFLRPSASFRVISGSKVSHWFFFDLVVI